MLKNLLTICFILFIGSLYAQETEVDVAALKAEIATKEAQVKTMQGEVEALKASMPPTYGWKYGAAGVIGLNFSSFNQWLGAENANTFSSNLGFAGNAHANLLKEKYFWRNDGNLTMGWTKLDTNTDDEFDSDYEKTADAINISSLYGYKLSEKWAASALAEYRSTILNNFNNPGFLDVGVGVTWTPISDLLVVIHPLNYNFVFAEEGSSYESSLGAKIVASYAKQLPKGIAWNSKLSAFVSYSDPSNLSNWTWINGFNLTVLKGLGVGFELGLRGNKQEGYNKFLSADDATGNAITSDNFKIDDLKTDDNPFQSYWLLGITYNL